MGGDTEHGSQCVSFGERPREVPFQQRGGPAPVSKWYSLLEQTHRKTNDKNAMHPFIHVMQCRVLAPLTHVRQ